MVKTKCTYWAKCYRKDAAHKKQFLHPGDEDDEIEELVKNGEYYLQLNIIYYSIIY